MEKENVDAGGELLPNWLTDKDTFLLKANNY